MVELRSDVDAISIGAMRELEAMYEQEASLSTTTPPATPAAPAARVMATRRDRNPDGTKRRKHKNTSM